MTDALVKERRQARKDRSRPVRYEDDLYSWVSEQVVLLRARRFDELDCENIAEELSDVGSEQFDKLSSALEVLLMHMLKWDHQPGRRTRSWTLTIAEHRDRVLIQLRKNPGLKSCIAEALADGYRLGASRAAREMKTTRAALPAACPYDWDDVLNRPFDVDQD